VAVAVAFAFALAVAVALLFVIPEGNLLFVAVAVAFVVFSLCRRRPPAAREI